LIGQAQIRQDKIVWLCVQLFACARITACCINRKSFFTQPGFQHGGKSQVIFYYQNGMWHLYVFFIRTKINFFHGVPKHGLYF